MDNSFKSNVSSNVMDIKNLDSLRKRALSNDAGALKEVAQQFESLFTNMLMKSMREANAVFETDSPMNNNYTQFYRDMQDKQMAADMSQSGSLGLADVIVQQLSNGSGNYMPASSLQGDSDPLKKLQAAEKSNPMTDKTPLATDEISSSADKTSSSMDKKSLEQVSAAAPEDETEQAQVASLSAPVAKSDQVEAKRKIHFDSPQDFISSLAPFAQSVAKKLNVSPNVLLAQAALETGWGKKVSTDSTGESSHNLFNIKA
ncbi:MAG: flagellar protein FlgJ, partial [Moritella sp.]